MNILNIKKIVSVIVINCFVFTTVLGQIPTIPMQFAVNNAVSNKTFTLPDKLGKITKKHFTDSDRLIVAIQDLHCHPEVQKNISKIINMLDKYFGVNNIYLEGAYGNVNTSWINRLQQKNRDISDRLINTGRLTGAEHYSALSGRTDIIKGLENKEPYIDNLKRFADILNNQEEIKVFLKWIEKSTAGLKKGHFSNNQRQIEKLDKKYDKGSLTDKQYYSMLVRIAEKSNIDISQYRNIMLSITKQNFNPKKTAEELRKFIDMLKSGITYLEYKKFLQDTDNLSNTDKLLKRLPELSDKYNLGFYTKFKELSKYAAYFEQVKRINPVNLIKEKELLIKELIFKFCNTEEEKEIVFIAYFKKYLKNYLSAKITSEDYEFFKENFNEYKRLWIKYIGNAELHLLDKYIEITDKFYEINNSRNLYFEQNIFNVLNSTEENKKIDIVITGGFHTEAMCNIFDKHNISYIVITPRILKGLSKAEETYYRIAKEQVQISFQTLANLALSLSKHEQITVLKSIGIPNEEIIEIYGTDSSNIISAAEQISENKINPLINIIKNIIKRNPEIKTDFISNIKEKYSIEIDQKITDKILMSLHNSEYSEQEFELLNWIMLLNCIADTKKIVRAVSGESYEIQENAEELLNKLLLLLAKNKEVSELLTQNAEFYQDNHLQYLSELADILIAAQKKSSFIESLTDKITNVQQYAETIENMLADLSVLQNNETITIKTSPVDIKFQIIMEEKLKRSKITDTNKLYKLIREVMYSVLENNSDMEIYLAEEETKNINGQISFQLIYTDKKNTRSLPRKVNYIYKNGTLIPYAVLERGTVKQGGTVDWMVDNRVKNNPYIAQQTSELKFDAGTMDKVDNIILAPLRKIQGSIQIMEKECVHIVMAHDSNGAIMQENKNETAEPDAENNPIFKAEHSILQQWFDEQFYEQEISLQGHIVLMPDGVIVYMIDDKKLIDKVQGVKEKFGNTGIVQPPVVMMTIGRITDVSDNKKLETLTNSINETILAINKNLQKNRITTKVSHLQTGYIAVPWHQKYKDFPSHDYSGLKTESIEVNGFTKSVHSDIENIKTMLASS